MASAQNKNPSQVDTHIMIDKILSTLITDYRGYRWLSTTGNSSGCKCIGTWFRFVNLVFYGPSRRKTLWSGIKSQPVL